MSGTQPAAVDVRERLDSVLNTPRRRFVLSYLQTQRQSVTIDELATAIDMWERLRGKDQQKTSREQHRLGLRHVHLPMLARAGLVEFGSETARVDLAVDPDRLRQSLQSTAPASNDTVEIAETLIRDGASNPSSSCEQSAGRP